MSANGCVAEESKSLKKELKEKDTELKKIGKNLKRKEAALAETAALLFLRKKTQAIREIQRTNDSSIRSPKRCGTNLVFRYV